MELCVCIFDLESGMLCPSCQSKLDRGEITQFDVDFSSWILDRAEKYSGIDNLHLRRAIQTNEYVVLVVERGQSDMILSNEKLVEDIEEEFGDLMVIEGPSNMRTLIKKLIDPVVEVGINSLYLPDGTKESIVMLREEDRKRLRYSSETLGDIISAVTGQHVIFDFQTEEEEEEEEEETDTFAEKMKEFSSRRRF
ncbi:MAG: hypothetical protein KGY80_04980 [Candidatus Thorarchaeota archaeon]|nr:hypothetical protein [Candidatus Thorarchaeota archaeon]